MFNLPNFYEIFAIPIFYEFSYVQSNTAVKSSKTKKDEFQDMSNYGWKKEI